MSARIARDVLLMCRGFGSVEVSAPGGTLRGMLDEMDVEEGVPGYEGQTRLVTRRVLRVPTASVVDYAIDRDCTVTAESVDYKVRDLKREADGAVTVVVLISGARRAT